MNEQQIVKLLQDLVRIPSVNPSGETGTSPKNTGEAQMAEYVGEFLTKLGCDVEAYPVQPNRPNVIAHFPSRGAKKKIALAPHTDTVSVAGMTIDPFGGEIRDGKLYGRGACDTKGPMSAMLAALANLARDKNFREGNLDVYFCALMGEESGNDGARALMNNGFTADFAIAAEPTDLKIVHTHKGALWFKIITRGRSVHGSMPEKGENAIEKMTRVVHFLTHDYRPQLSLIRNPRLGSPTLSVGVIRGGAQTNVVPDYCEIEVDMRTVPPQNHEKILQDLRQQLENFGIETQLIRSCEPLDTPLHNEFLQKLNEICGGDALTVAPWFCDAAIFSEFGVPAVAFGPGSVAQAHTADEHIELAQVCRAAEILQKFLADLSRA